MSEPGRYLDTVPEVRLAERLHEFALLPEEKRKKFVETVSKYAIEGEDTAALDNHGIRRIFKDDEFEHLRDRVRAELLPRLDDVRLEWESGHRSDEPPDEHMQQLLESFDTLRKCFPDDESAAEIINREIGRANDWIAEHTSEQPESTPRTLGGVESSHKPETARSLFDDIDADEDYDRK